MTAMIEPVLELGNFDRCWSLGRYEIGEILWSIVREIPLGDSSVVIYIYIYGIYRVSLEIGERADKSGARLPQGGCH